MKVSFGTLALFSLVPAIMGLTIDTPPSVAQCEPVQFTWNGGTPPFYLSLLPAAQVSAPPLKSFPVQTGTTYTWNCDLGTGSTFTISLKDSTGLSAYSSIVSVGPGADASCLNANVTETAGSATGPVQISSTASLSTTAPSSTTTGKKSAATQHSIGAFGFAALIGLIGATLF